MFIFKNYNKYSNYNTLCLNTINYQNKNYIDAHNIVYFTLNGILIWLNILHINIILVKHSFLIILNNLEYLILLISVLTSKS